MRDRPHHIRELPPKPHVARVLLPRDHRHVPVQVFHREPVMDADVGALDAGEEAFDPVRVGPVLCLVGLAVVHALEDRQTDEIIIRAMFVRGQHRLRMDGLLLPPRLPLGFRRKRRG